MYVNYIMLSFFLYYMFHLSTAFVYPTTLPVHQPFEAVMEVSGVKTRYSEQTMLPAEADILLVYAQTWQGYITHIMHMLYCNA